MSLAPHLITTIARADTLIERQKKPPQKPALKKTHLSVNLMDDVGISLKFKLKQIKVSPEEINILLFLWSLLTVQLSY